MKKLIPFILALCLGLAGCVTMSKEAGHVALEIAARNAAYQLAQHDPDIVKPGKVLMQAIQKHEEQDVIANLEMEIWEYLQERYYDHPMLLDDIQSIRSMLIVEGEVHLPSLQIVARGAYKGLEYAN
jgi:hypothetical protein